MRRTTALLATTLLTLLTACGSSSDDKPAAKPKATPTVTKEERYLTAARDAGFASWEDTMPSDSELAAFPQEWCDALDAGHSVDWLFNEGGLYPHGSDWGTKKPEANELLVMGVKTYCPDLREQVAEELRASGEY